MPNQTDTPPRLSPTTSEVLPTRKASEVREARDRPGDRTSRPGAATRSGTCRSAEAAVGQTRRGCRRRPSSRRVAVVGRAGVERKLPPRSRIVVLPVSRLRRRVTELRWTVPVESRAATTGPDGPDAHVDQVRGASASAYGLVQFDLEFAVEELAFGRAPDHAASQRGRFADRQLGDSVGDGLGREIGCRQPTRPNASAPSAVPNTASPPSDEKAATRVSRAAPPSVRSRTRPSSRLRTVNPRRRTRSRPRSGARQDATWPPFRRPNPATRTMSRCRAVERGARRPHQKDADE